MSTDDRKAHCLAPASADAASVDQQIAALDVLDLGALRTQFRNRTGRIAPVRMSRGLLLRVVAYRIQADLYGDLRPETRRLLERLASAGTAAANAGDVTVPPSLVGRPRAGTVLVREWGSRMEHVMVLEDGFGWSGKTYPSLSAVALAITGTKWNGRRFFGLDQSTRQAPASSPGIVTKGAARQSGVTASKRPRRATPRPCTEPKPGGVGRRPLPDGKDSAQLGGLT